MKATDNDVLANAERLVNGSDPNDFVGADAFVVVVRRLTDACDLDISGPFDRLEAARASAQSARADLANEHDGGDYFVEVRPIYADGGSMIRNHLDADRRPTLVGLNSIRTRDKGGSQ